MTVQEILVVLSVDINGLKSLLKAKHPIIIVTVAIANNATYGSGTPYYIAYQVSVPPNSSVIVTDKTSSFYVTENQSVGVISGTGSALHYTATFEAIT